MQDLSAFQRDLLYALAGLDEPHGLKVKHEMEEYYGKDINHGRLYPNLDDLVDAGFIDKGKHDDRTNSYQITKKGRKKIDTRAAWERQYYKPKPQIAGVGSHH